MSVNLDPLNVFATSFMIFPRRRNNADEISRIAKSPCLLPDAPIERDRQVLHDNENTS